MQAPAQCPPNQQNLHFMKRFSLRRIFWWNTGVDPEVLVVDSEEAVMWTRLSQLRCGVCKQILNQEPRPLETVHVTCVVGQQGNGKLWTGSDQNMSTYEFTECPNCYGKNLLPRRFWPHSSLLKAILDKSLVQDHTHTLSLSLIQTIVI
jgi:hypothetical protein